MKYPRIAILSVLLGAAGLHAATTVLIMQGKVAPDHQFPSCPNGTKVSLYNAMANGKPLFLMVTGSG